MNRNRAIALILLVLIVAQGSDASLFSKLRKLVATTPVVNGTRISPSPAPISETKPNHTEKPNNSSGVVDPKGSNVPEKPKNDTHIDKDSNQQVINEKCESSDNRCIQKTMIACLKPLKKGSQDFIILIQNDGESKLNVTLVVSDSVKVSTKELEISQHHAKKIDASTNVGENLKIVLNAGYGDCVLYTGGVPISEDNFFRRIPSYANNLTPIHGAYFIFLVALIVGGTWACCKLGKKGQHGNGGVPYQELEMALPESASAVNVDPENGWDEGWDDDWDEEKAVKSPGKLAGNLLANGLTSKSPNRDGWENDWDE